MKSFLDASTITARQAGKGSFAATLAQVGLVNADIKSKAVSVPVTVMFDGKLWAVAKSLQYKATKGKSGIAK